jgi:hypothetical protein
MNDLFAYLNSAVKDNLELAIKDLSLSQPSNQLSFLAEWLDRRAAAIDDMRMYLESYNEAKNVRLEIRRFNEYDKEKNRVECDQKVNGMIQAIRHLGENVRLDSGEALVQLTRDLEAIVGVVHRSWVFLVDTSTTPLTFECVSPCGEDAGLEEEIVCGLSEESAGKYVDLENELLIRVNVGESFFIVKLQYEKDLNAGMISSIVELFTIE